MIELPGALQSAVETALAHADSKHLTRVAHALSDRYRAERAPGERLVRTEDDALAYAAWILPATHAQAAGSLRMLCRRAGDFAPRTLLDLGAGPGTVAWAAAALWPSLERIVHVERDPSFVALGRRLAHASPHESVRSAQWRTDDLRRLDLGTERFDLVVAAHVVGELETGDAGWLVREAWRACSGALAIVEPGTPAGFGRIEPARRALLASGARMLAPCPHHDACPLAGGELAEPPDWCHFAERSQRPAFQKRMKGAELGWEDAKFAFVAVARFESSGLPWARVLRHPVHGKGHVELDLCAREGRERRTIGRSAPQWKLARKLEWGSALEEP